MPKKIAVEIPIASCQRNRWCRRPNRHRGVCSKRSTALPINALIAGVPKLMLAERPARVAFEVGRTTQPDPARAFVDLVLDVGIERSALLLARVRAVAAEVAHG